MVTLSPASIVVIPFPFSDLSATKLRPAVVIADAGLSDWLLCQITSNSYRDSQAVRITNQDLANGQLAKVSYARPTKLFTASSGLIKKRIAILNDDIFTTLVEQIIVNLQNSLPK